MLAGLGGLASAAAGIWISTPDPPYPWPMWLIIQTVGISFEIVGVIAWYRLPERGTGRLMMLVGITWYIGDLQTSHNRVLVAFGFCLFYLTSAVFMHLILTLPAGRLPGRPERIVVACMYVATTVPQVLRFVTEYPASPQIWGRTDNLSVWAAVGSISAGALTVAALSLLVRRWRRAGRPARRRFQALWTTGAISAAIVVLWIGLLWTSLVWRREVLGGSTVDIGRAMLVAYALALIVTPFGLLTGLIRVRLARLSVADLVTRLDGTTEAGAVRAAISNALGDPTLQVWFCLPSGDFADATGRRCPVLPSGDQAVTWVERQGDRLAALVHDPGLSGQTKLIDAVVAAARLALENARLHAAHHAQLAEVRASRTRIVAAADEERHRIQRDLHDGAQHKLLAISLLFGQVREGLRRHHAPATTAELLDRAATQLHDVIRELRELTEGIDPPALSEQGLAAVVETLAERAPLPVLFDVPPGRWDPALERTAYFVINEALANVYKHARASRATVRVDCDGQVMVVHVADDGVGGADPDEGTGLRGLRDRVATVNGELYVDSVPGAGTTIRAELPCGS